MLQTTRTYVWPLAALCAICLVATARAGVITDPTNSYSVGISSAYGDLYDGPPGILGDPTGVGFRRNADGWDPLNFVLLRASWGVSAGADSGFANEGLGPTTLNIVPNTSAFGAHTASVSAYLNPGAGDLLRVDQDFRFAAPNVLSIDTSITNISGLSQDVRFSRTVDFDMYLFNSPDVARVDPLTGAVVASSGFGFENPDPLVPFSFAPADPGGELFPANDRGASYLLDLGTVAAGDTTSFVSYFALNEPGQSEDELRAQLASLGATFTITNFDLLGPLNMAALSYGPATNPVPEPSSLALLGIGSIGLIGYARRRRRSAVKHL